MLPLSGHGLAGEPVAARAGAVTVYVFRDLTHDAVCSVAPGRDVIKAFGNLAGLSVYFGGYMTFGRVFSSNEFLGVWGQRNASRFRRILHERLGEIEILHSKPPARHACLETNGPRPTRLERNAFEQRIKLGPSRAS